MLAFLETRLVEPGWVTADAFLAGYGAAQALPGPLFTFAAYLNAIVAPRPNGIVGAAIALSAFILLTAWRVPPWLVVVVTVLGAIALGLVSQPARTSPTVSEIALVWRAESLLARLADGMVH